MQNKTMLHWLFIILILRFALAHTTSQFSLSHKEVTAARRELKIRNGRVRNVISEVTRSVNVQPLHDSLLYCNDLLWQLNSWNLSSFPCLCFVIFFLVSFVTPYIPIGYLLIPRGLFVIFLEYNNSVLVCIGCNKCFMDIQYVICNTYEA